MIILTAAKIHYFSLRKCFLLNFGEPIESPAYVSKIGRGLHAPGFVVGLRLMTNRWYNRNFLEEDQYIYELWSCAPQTINILRVTVLVRDLCSTMGGKGFKIGRASC